MGINNIVNKREDGTGVKTLKEFDYKIPSTIDGACEAISSILQMLKGVYTNLNEDSLFELRVVLNELFLNAVKHGNKHDSSKLIKASVGITFDDYVYIIVEDEGEGCDYEYILSHSDQNDQEALGFNDMKETGRGVLIVSSPCDSIRYNKKGNKIIVLKKVYTH